MTLQDFINALKNAETLVEQGLATTDALAKQYGATNISLPVEAAEMLVPIFGDLLNRTLDAYNGASSTPITVENLQKLLPDPTPLTPPTE